MKLLLILLTIYGCYGACPCLESCPGDNGSSCGDGKVNCCGVKMIVEERKSVGVEKFGFRRVTTTTTPTTSTTTTTTTTTPPTTTSTPHRLRLLKIIKRKPISSSYSKIKTQPTDLTPYDIVISPKSQFVDFDLPLKGEGTEERVKIKKGAFRFPPFATTTTTTTEIVPVTTIQTTTEPPTTITTTTEKNKKRFKVSEIFGNSGNHASEKIKSNSGDLETTKKANIPFHPQTQSILKNIAKETKETKIFGNYETPIHPPYAKTPTRQEANAINPTHVLIQDAVLQHLNSYKRSPRETKSFLFHKGFLPILPYSRVV